MTTKQACACCTREVARLYTAPNGDMLCEMCLGIFKTAKLASARGLSDADIRDALDKALDIYFDKG